MEYLLSNVALLLTVIGVLAFTVSVITEVTKSVSFLNKIPTDIQVLVTSILLSVLSVLIYVDLSKTKIIWYYVIGAVVLGFFVAFVSMYGWEKLTTMYNRFKK